MSGNNYLDKLLGGAAVEWRALGEIAEIYGGLTGKVKADFDGGDARYISYKNIYFNQTVDFDYLEAVGVTGSENQNAIAYGDVLFTASSETADEVGMSSSVATSFVGPVYLNSFSFGVRFNQDVPLDPDYSKHLFRSSFMRTEIAKTASGVTRFNISKDRFRKVQVPIPCPDHTERSLAIQAEIARTLDAFVELTVELTAELTARKKQYDYYRAYLLRFADGEMEWKTLGDIGDVKMCKRVLKHETQAEGDIPFYKIGTFGRQADAFIPKEIYESYKARYSFPKLGDVLISAAGTIGRAVVYDGKPAYFQDSNIVWIDNDESVVTNRYLWHFYRIAKWFVSEGGTIDRLYNDNIRKTGIPVPFPGDTSKSLAEQARVVAMLDRFDAFTNSSSEGLPREIALRHQQYAYYRDLLLNFPKPEEVAG